MKRETRSRIIARSLLALLVLLPATTSASDPETGAPDASVSDPGSAAAVVATPEAEGGPAGAAPALDLTRPRSPSASTKDWIQLKSGEWLRGRVKRMRDASLEFDSDELDDLEVDWKNIIEVRSPLPHTYVFERDRIQFSITGPARVDKTKVSLLLGEEIHEYPREELLAILRGESRRDYWSAKFSVGLTLRVGNTDQVEFSTFGWLRRETGSTRVRLDYTGAFGALNGETVANNQRTLISFDYFFSRKLYFTPMRFEAFKDTLQNIEYRLTPSIGLGYKLMRRGSIEWDVDLGIGYQITNFVSVPQGDPESQSGTAVVFSTRFESDITKRTDVKANYKLNLSVSDLAQTSHHAELIFSVDIYKAIDLDINLTLDRIEDPPESADGTPEKNDLRLVVGLGIEF